MDFISDKIINKKREREEILIAELAITDDDAIHYSKYWEKFKRITIKELCIICYALNIEITDLFKGIK